MGFCMQYYSNSVWGDVGDDIIKTALPPRRNPLTKLRPGVVHRLPLQRPKNLIIGRRRHRHGHPPGDRLQVQAVQILPAAARPAQAAQKSEDIIRTASPTQDKNTYDYELEGKWKCIHAEDLLKGAQVFVPNYEVKQKEGVFLSFGSKTEIWYLVQSTAIKGAVKRQQ